MREEAPDDLLGIPADALAQRGKSDADERFEQAAELLEEHAPLFERSNLYRTWARYLRDSGRESAALDVLDRAAQLSASAR